MNFESHINEMIAEISLFSIVALFDVKQIGVFAQFSGNNETRKQMGCVEKRLNANLNQSLPRIVPSSRKSNEQSSENFTHTHGSEIRPRRINHLQMLPAKWWHALEREKKEQKRQSIWQFYRITKSMCTLMVLCCCYCRLFLFHCDRFKRALLWLHSFEFRYTSDETFVQVARTRVQVTITMVQTNVSRGKQLQESTCTQRHRSVWHIPRQKRKAKQAKRIRWSSSSSLMQWYQNALSRVSYLFSYIFIRITFG